MRTLEERLVEIFSNGGHYSVDELFGLLDECYGYDEIEDALANMGKELKLTAMWFPKDDHEEFEKFTDFIGQ